jgi:hypothetical protein
VDENHRRADAGFLVVKLGAVGAGDRGHAVSRLWLERDDFSSHRHPAVAFCLSMILSENRLPPRVKSGAGFFGIIPERRTLAQAARGSKSSSLICVTGSGRKPPTMS